MTTSNKFRNGTLAALIMALAMMIGCASTDEGGGSDGGDGCKCSTDDIAYPDCCHTGT
jgi:hypothetical protein